MSQLLQNALYGAVMILAVAVLRRVLGDRLIPGARLALWAVCLFRLLTPAAPESALSLWGLSRLFEAEKQAAPVGYAPRPVPAVAAPAPAVQPGPVISWETVLLALWLAVGAALAVRYVASWRRTRRAVACAIPLEREDRRYAALPKCARLREGPMEGAPLTFGVARPTVVLSPGLEGGPLECVLAHEGVHAARRDNLWHYAMALALAAHWWNPAVWLMARLLRRDVELSCDRAALKKLGEDRRAEYAQTLVSLAVQGSGPAFCQTFGRRAAEERIRSIMKFKKTSIIGVIFTLALVLAVTAAFASEPKTDDATIQFHGETFQRADLSQATLDWLDWYLALPKEEQLAISSIPPELIRGSAPAPYDAYDGEKIWSIVSVPDIEGTKGIQSDVDEVSPDDVDLSMMRERLAQKVAAGELTQETADEMLAGTESMLEQARRGELKLFLTTDVNGEEFLYGSGVSRMYYKDEDGNLIPFDPGKAGVGYSTSSPIDDYTVNTEPAGVIGSRFYSYEVVTDPEAVAAAGIIGEATPCVSPEPVAEQPLVNSVPAAACGVEGCTETRNHVHANGCAVLVYDPCPVEGCAIPGNHTHNGVNYSCNGFHSGGHCDGNCPSYSTAYPSASSGHHDESHSSGHHGSGHH